MMKKVNSVSKSEGIHTGIEPFDFEGAKVRTVMQGDMPWFNANDVCKALGYATPRDAVRDHVDEEDITKLDTISDGCDVAKSDVTSKSKARKSQMMSYINESGLYALIFGSGKPKAKRFKRWVTSEVLPTIRKTGSYQNVMALGQYRLEESYPVVGPYELSPAFFARLYYALAKNGSDAAIVFQLLRMGALNHWIEISYRELSKSMDYAVSYSTANARSHMLYKHGILDMVVSQGKLTRCRVDQVMLDLFMSRVPEMRDMRPGLPYITKEMKQLQ